MATLGCGSELWWELVCRRAVEKFGEVGYRGSSAINGLADDHGVSSDQKAEDIADTEASSD